jgi:protein tyrosine phosphatase (PTP) superfamily phosphohydrolase (DUF442 family)
MRKKVFLWLLGLTGLMFVGLISYILFNLLTGNFHTVIDQKVYRSAQISSSDLEYYVKKYNIKSIVNLRNDVKNRYSLRNEKLIAQKYHINYYNIQLASQQLPKLTDLKQLVNVLETAPTPILIHCKAGADRTGLASAISILLDDNRDIDDMEDQISWQYNVYSDTTIGYQTIKNYLDWLEVTKKENSRESFLIWLNSVTTLKAYSGWFFT